MTTGYIILLLCAIVALPVGLELKEAKRKKQIEQNRRELKNNTKRNA